MRNNPRGDWNWTLEPWATKEDVNWKLWVGKNIRSHDTFSAEEYIRWRKYYCYSAGLVSDRYVAFRLYSLLEAMGQSSFPCRVASIGTRNVHTDALSPAPKRDCPECIQLLAEFPDHSTIHFIASTVNGQGLPWSIRGSKATLMVGDDEVILKPETPFATEVKPERISRSSVTINDHCSHWLKSIRQKGSPENGIELAVRAQTIISLAEMSHRMNLVCLFDEKTRTIRDGFGKEVKPLYYTTDL